MAKTQGIPQVWHVLFRNDSPLWKTLHAEGQKLDWWVNAQDPEEAISTVIDHYRGQNSTMGVLCDKLADYYSKERASWYLTGEDKEGNKWKKQYEYYNKSQGTILEKAPDDAYMNKKAWLDQAEQEKQKKAQIEKEKKEQEEKDKQKKIIEANKRAKENGQPYDENVLNGEDDWEKHYGKHGQDWFEGKDQNQEPEQETKPYKGYQKLWDFGIRYRDEKINPTIPDEDLDNTEWNFRHGKTGTAVQAAMYAKTGQVVDKRKWIRNWIEEYNAKTKDENKSALGQTMFLLEKWFGGEVKVALPFIGEWGKHPLATGLKGISDCIMSISASFNIALDILHQIPEWLRLTNIFLRDMEAYQKEIISMLAPTMTMINEDLIPYISQQKEIAERSFEDGLPIYTEPNSPEQLKSIEALYTLINNPFTGYKYKGMLEHARLRHYQDVTKTGFADGWAMLDYVLNNPEGGGMQVRTPGTIEPEQELAKILPPTWYLSGNAPKGLKEAFKTEHKAGHAQIKDINRRGGFE